MKEHFPERPSWDCGKCGVAWPCANAKMHLASEYRGSNLALLVYMAMHFSEAFDDYAAAGEIPADLRERFLGWVR